MNKDYIISVDLGGTKILSALINSQNKIVSRVKIPTEVKKGEQGLIDSIVKSLNQLILENNISEKNVKALCLGVPGTVNPFSGIISNAPNIYIKNFNIKEALSKHTIIPVLVENDVNLAGLGIKKFEFNDEIKNMLIVFIGTGIGSALFFEGKLYRGSTFYAGEIGHMIINGKGAFSSKKSSSTFELTASRLAIIKAIKKEIKKGKKSILKEFLSSDKSIKSKTLAYAVAQNDNVAVKQVSKACETIGTVLGSLTTFLNFDTIVLGGGVIEAMHKFMLPRIKVAFKNSVLPECGRNVKISVTKLGDDAALFGGVALAEEFLINENK
ncbi:MAG: ROK family protein [Melioribacter sp.]|uniref:ROK family protein n=1 Tax=Rosettibacter primus TaxID=3111523 RepID=UPI00247CCBA8|nr:ROK family protein [Melioribacter sp.]